MYLLIPGRHQLLTNFQFSYLQSVINDGLNVQKDVNGNAIGITGNIEAIIFAVTSANHSNTRRNPLMFYLRAIAIEAFGNKLSVPVYIYGIDDVGSLDDFAAYTIKRIRHDSDLQFQLNPSNTVVVCSTVVLEMYERLGYKILPAELESRNTWKHKEAMPWDIVEKIATVDNWQENDTIHSLMHQSSYDVWKKYKLGEKVQLLFRDSIISSDGDLTTTRDYNIYVRQMDEIAGMKYTETAGFIQPGRIGDIGCAVGSWIRLATSDERFRESDFYGIEVSRHLYEICQQRKLNGEFQNPFVFFSQRNAVTGLVFEKDSMNTIHTSSLTYEIESYGNRQDLLHFIANRYNELAPGGVWVNRDVVGPYNKDKEVLLWLNQDDGINDPAVSTFSNSQQLSQHLQSLSTYARFFWFADGFRKEKEPKLQFELIALNNTQYVKLSLRHATEFLTRKDYTENWESELHETFCYWDFDEWKQHLTDAGFKIHTDSNAYTNPWIVEHRWKGKAAIYTRQDDKLVPEEFPLTTMLLIGVKV